MLEKWLEGCRATSLVHYNKHPPWHKTLLREMLQNCLPMVPRYDALEFCVEVDGECVEMLETSASGLKEMLLRSSPALQQYVHPARLIHWKRRPPIACFSEDRIVMAKDGWARYRVPQYGTAAAIELD